jgi:hypothetical protein
VGAIVQTQDTDYARFINSKSQYGTAAGFEPLWIPDFLFPFQKHLCEWWIRSGRGALFEGCGMGKTPQQLVCAENVVRHTNKPVLILTPLAVSHQFTTEAEKFGIECIRSRDGKFPAGARIVVTNYERLHYFNSSDFGGVFADESSILKNFDGVTKAEVTEFMRTHQYRGLATATPSPNDYVELGTAAEALGAMGYRDMITTFFKQATAKDHLGWGRTKYVMRNYAEKDFWKWVCSWSRAVRKPSDLGFEDGDFVLPELVINEHKVESRTTQPGRLFDVPAFTLEEQREERRRTLTERCEKAAELAIAHKGPSVCWAHLNDEGDLMADLIPGAKQVSGSNSDDEKEELLQAFAQGQITKLVTKSVLAGFGLNWQHCAHQVHFPSHSWEQYHQCVHRSQRFGQKRQVHIDIITTEGDFGVMENHKKKANASEAMFGQLVANMNDVLKIQRSTPFTLQEQKPSWLTIN